MSLDVYLCRDAAGVHELYSANVTHNLNTMANKAGIYEPVWRPDEVGIVRAAQLIEPLRKGIEALEADPEFFMAFEPENKWGTYERFVPWLHKYLAACVTHPDAFVRVSR